MATDVKAVVTGGTGFVGAHVVKLLNERRADVKVVYRNPDRLNALRGLEFARAKADVLDYRAMRRALSGADILFHTAGYVGSSPAERVWRINAQAPVVAVEAAAAEGVKRVVLTSTISAVGPPQNGQPADETTEYPENWLGLAYPDSKHEGEVAALDAGKRHGVEVVVVNPAYVFGVPVARTNPAETSNRTVVNYLRGRLPGVVEAPMNFVDVEDVAAGHLQAAEHGRPGERYILGGQNMTWPQLIDCIAEMSDIYYPVLVLPPEIATVARVREALGIRGPISAEAYELMGKNWQFSSDKAERELGYRPRPIEETLMEMIGWYRELLDGEAFADANGSALATIASGMQTARRLGLLHPVRAAQRVVGRRVVAGV